MVGVALTRRRPFIEVPQLDRQHRGLQRIDAEIAADEGMMIFGLATVHAQHTQVLGELWILRRTHARVAEGTEVLGRKKRQAPDCAHAASPLACRGVGADGLRSVLDDRQREFPRDRPERLHGCALAVEMHRHQRAHALARGPRDQLSVPVLTVLLQPGAHRAWIEIE